MKINKILVLILILATFFRFYQLTTLPALNADEASIGYNAYSLIKTGLDEHGHPWPIHFQSFNDFKPGLFFYAVLPSIAVFGLNVFAVRLPGALLGILGVLGVWLLVKELFPDKKIKFNGFEISLAGLSALLLAVSPWHIHFSRGGWEVNMATTLMIFGTLYFIKARQKIEYLPISIILFVMSLYTYHAARVVVPLLGIILMAVYWKDFWKHKRELIGSSLFSIIILFPLAIELIGPGGLSRAGGVSIFSDHGVIDRINQQRGQHEDLNSLDAKLIHNKYVEYTLAFSKNYMDHFWGEFLFLSGDEIQRNKVPEIGELYLFEFPLLLLSLFAIPRDKRKRNWLPIIAWLLVAPTAAALTFQSPHALRAQNMVIPLTILSAYGLFIFLDFIKNRVNKRVLKNSSYLIIITIFVWSVARYLHQYYSHMAKTYPFSSQYGVEELVDYVSKNQDKFDKIIVTDRYDQPYILFLFYMKYPPQKFQGHHQLSPRDEYGFSTVRNFDKYEFQSIDWNKVRDQRNVLVVGTPKEIEDEGANVVKQIYFPNGDIAFKIVELK